MERGKKLSEEEKKEICARKNGILSQKNGDDTYVFGTLKINNWKIVEKISFNDFELLYQKNTIYLFVLLVSKFIYFWSASLCFIWTGNF